MIRTLKYVFLVGAFPLLLGSCKEKIKINIPDAAPLLVVESEVTTEMDSSFVRLTLSSNYFATADYPIISTASVSVNGAPFLFDAIKKLYKPAPGFVGKRDSTYKLLINYDGKTYTSTARLEPMFRIDSFIQKYKPASGFFKAGYALSYIGFDNRPPIKYTYFENGKLDTLTGRDSMDDRKTLFSSDQTPINQTYSFEIPFARFQSGETYICIFRSVDQNMYDFIDAWSSQTSGAPGPFQTPPANLPTNIIGGAVGYFATYDVSRWRYRVK